MATTDFSHPSIGTFKASAAQDGVLQFLGVRYATLADRFAPAVLRQYSNGSDVDASQHGPQPLSIPDGPAFEMGLVQQKLEYDHGKYTMSDTDCLNLNITLPVDSSGKVLGEKLPVFAFVHGGGFMNGSASFPQYDMARFVRLSVKNGMPVIAAAFNYRLGAPGFLYSDEMTESGYKPNNGFRDQRTALLWLQQYLSGFGGDPANVTLMGESAGSMSVCMHLHSKKPLFKRAMMMSGTTLLLPAVPEPVANGIYAKAIETLGLEELASQDRVKKLLSIDGQELRVRLMQAGVGTLPVLDGELCPVAIDWKSVLDHSLNLPGREWCEGVIIGDCAFDGSINSLRLGQRKPGIARSFHSSLSSSLPTSVSAKIFEAYGLTPDTPDDEAFIKVLEATNDLHFYAPTVAFAQNLSAKMPTYVYRFNEPNHWPGPWQGKVSHIHDLIYLSLNFNEHLSEHQRQLAEEFASNVISFVNGQEPWKAYKSAKVFKAGGTAVVVDEPGKVGRRKVVFDVAEEVGWDGYAEALGAWFRG